MMILFLSVLISAGLLLPVVDYAYDNYNEHDYIEYVRQIIIGELMEPNVDSSLIEELKRTIRDDGSWPRIDYEDVSRTEFQHRDHVANLVQLARAYKKPASEFFGNDQLKEVIDDALGFWLAHDFIADNWHSNEIANPRNWASFMLIMDESLAEDQSQEVVRLAARANLDAWGARPGGDMIRIAGIKLKRAFYARDGEMIEKARDAIESELNFTSGRGLKPDFSFNHRTDRVTSTLSYGTGYAASAAVWARRLSGTVYALPEESLQLLIDFFMDGIVPNMVHGWYRDPGAMNRAMATPSALSPSGSALAIDLLESSAYRADELQAIIDIRNEQNNPNLSGNHFFWHVEYASHQRPGYFTSVRMYSDRNHNMEYPHNQQSLKHHHFADGSNFISRTGEEYKDIFVVWDWQKIPGTTVVQKSSLPEVSDIVKRGKTDFVGAVSDGRYGLAALDFESPHDPLSARKSWFFFDDEWVNLGAGITSHSNYPVATTLNQSLLNGNVVVGRHNSASVPATGEHILDDVSWVHHDGVAYLFPKPTEVNLLNKSQAGSWSDINGQSWTADVETEEKDVFTLWIDHGPSPVEDTYEYVIVPGMEASDINIDGALSEISVVANTLEMQAVQHEGLNLVQVAFYEPTGIDINHELRVSARTPGLVMIEYADQSIKRITAADPTRQLDTFHFTTSFKLVGAGDKWRAVWNSETDYSDVYIQLPGDMYAGQSVVVDTRKAEHTDRSPVLDDLITNEAGDVGVEREGKEDGTFYVGQKYGGGVIFWVDESGTRGLIASENDQSDGVRWHNGPSRVTSGLGDHNARATNARGDGIGAGEMNTQIIVSQQTEDDLFGNFAARVCVDYQEGGYGDWYLPSKKELDLMYQEKEMIGGFGPYLYWSSTEYNIGFAWNQYFHGYGGQYTTPKGVSRVRCIRRL